MLEVCEVQFEVDNDGSHSILSQLERCMCINR